MRYVTLLAVFLALSGTGSALPGDCTCREENDRWQKAKEKVKDLGKQIQDVEKSIESHEKKISALENQLVSIRAMLEALEKAIDALFAAAQNGNPASDAGLASAQAGWAGLQTGLDTLFMMLDTGSAGNLMSFSTNFIVKMSQTYSLATSVQLALGLGIGFWSGSFEYGSPTTNYPDVGAMSVLAVQLRNYADQLQKLSLVINDLGIEKLFLDLDRKTLPQLQEELEKARAEEESARKAYEECLAEHHGGQVCARVVGPPTPTLKDKNLDLGTIDVLAATWLQPIGGLKK